MNKINSILLIGMFLLMAIPLISADEGWTFDNIIRDYSEEDNTIIVSNSILGIPTTNLAKYNLTFNADQMLLGGRGFEMNVDMYTSGRVMTDLKFKNKKEEYVNVSSYDLKIGWLVNNTYNISTYETVCETLNGANGTYEICNQEVNGSYEEEREEMYWENLNFSKEYDEGFYKITLDVDKGTFEELDWIIYGFAGIEFPEWAWWNSEWNYCMNINVSQGYNYINRTDIGIIEKNGNNWSSDGSDIRVVNAPCYSDGSEIKYNLINVTSSYMKVSYEVSNLSGTDTLEYSTYYGNPGATTTEDNSLPVFLSNETNIWASTNNSIMYTNEVGLLESWTWNATSTASGGIFWSLGGPAGGDGAGYLVSFGADSWMGYARSTPFYLGDNFRYSSDNNNRANIYHGIDLENDGTIDLSFVSQSNLNYNDLNTSTYKGRLASVYLFDNDATSWIQYANGNVSISNVQIEDYPLITQLGSEQQLSAINIYQIYPSNSTNSTLSSLNFSCNFTAVGTETLDNTSLIIYNSTDDLYYSNTNTSLSNNTYTQVNWSVTNIADDNYKWYCSANGEDYITNNRTFTIDQTPPEVNITSPLTSYDYLLNNQTLDLNWTVEDSPDSCWYYYNSNKYNLNCSDNSTTFNYIGGINNLTFYANDSFGNELNTQRNWSVKIVENYRTHNNQSYETQYETYKVNITANSSLTAVALNYNGTNYSMSNSGGGLWSYSRDLPENTVGNNSVNFKFTYGGSNINSEYTSYQLVNETTFIICNNETYTSPFINFTFQNEADFSSLNASITLSSFEYYLGSGTATKTYEYINTTDNENYAFCATPTNYTLYVNPYVQYKQGTSYPQRIYDPSLISLTNETLNKVLYLLGSTDGLYVTFQVVDSGNRPLEGVDSSAVRTISGESVTVGTGITDSAGGVTFWVNPDFSHTFTFVKTGYGSTIYSIIPTQSSYTVTLGANASEYIYVSNYDGLKWYSFPGVGIINQSVATNYGFNITSTNSNLVKCRMDIISKNKSVTLSTAESNSINSGSNCMVQTSYAINSDYPSIKGRLLIDIGNGWEILEDDAYWHYEALNSTGMTFTNWFNDLKTMDLSYFNNNEQHREYTSILIFFLVVTIICAVMNYSGWDIQTQGGMIYLMGLFIWIASIPGFLTLSHISPFGMIDKYFVAIVYTMFMIGMAVRRIT